MRLIESLLFYSPKAEERTSYFSSFLSPIFFEAKLLGQLLLFLHFKQLIFLRSARLGLISRPYYGLVSERLFSFIWQSKQVMKPRNNLNQWEKPLLNSIHLAPLVLKRFI